MAAHNRDDYVGTLTVPAHLLDFTRTALKVLAVAWNINHQPNKNHQRVHLYTTPDTLGVIAGALIKQEIPHLLHHRAKNIYRKGEFLKVDDYRVTHWLMPGVVLTVDWDQQEHIHKQQKVLALLDS